jgi:sec-independent protein translocase protein TatA
MTASFFYLLAFLPFGGGIGTGELIIIGIIAVLLFGKRLPEVGRSLGKGLVEFKKGMQGIEDEIRSASSGTSKSKQSSFRDLDDRDEPIAPKFEPPEST